MKHDGYVNLTHGIHDEKHPSIFHVSFKLRAEIILVRPWLKKHNVIHDHAADSIYLGTRNRRCIYLALLPFPIKVTSLAVPEVKHEFPPENAEAFLEIIHEHAASFHFGVKSFRQTMAVQHFIKLKDLSASHYIVILMKSVCILLLMSCILVLIYCPP